MGPFDLMFEM